MKPLRAASTMTVIALWVLTGMTFAAGLGQVSARMPASKEVLRAASFTNIQAAEAPLGIDRELARAEEEKFPSGRLTGLLSQVDALAPKRCGVWLASEIALPSFHLTEQASLFIRAP